VAESVLRRELNLPRNTASFVHLPAEPSLRQRPGPGKSATTGLDACAMRFGRLPFEEPAMPRTPTSLVVSDLSTFARQLGRALNARSSDDARCGRC
jgi:hypothetical protein